MAQMYIESAADSLSIHLTGKGSVAALFSMLMTAKFNDDLNEDRLFGIINNDLLRELSDWLANHDMDVVNHSTQWVHSRFSEKIEQKILEHGVIDSGSVEQITEAARLAFYPTPVPKDVLHRICRRKA